jgi:hypothetical protein
MGYTAVEGHKFQRTDDPFLDRPSGSAAGFIDACDFDEFPSPPISFADVFARLLISGVVILFCLWIIMITIM